MFAALIEFVKDKSTGDKTAQRKRNSLVHEVNRNGQHGTGLERETKQEQNGKG